MSLVKKVSIILVLVLSVVLSANLKGQNRLIDGVDSYNLVIKFRSEALVTVENRAIQFNGVRSAERATLNTLLAGYQFTSIFNFSENEKSQIRRGTIRSQKGRFDKYSFSGLVSLDDASTMDKAELLSLVEKLESLEIVEYCALESATPIVPPSTQKVRQTPDFAWRQWYKEYEHGGDTIGINIEAAWELGIKGQGVKIADIEWGMDYDHEDLKSPNFIEGLKTTDNSYDDHGTAVAGILIAKDNGFGVTGMVNQYDKFYGFSERTKGRPAAIAMAVDSLGAGDLIIYEMQTGGQGGEFVPADYNQAVWDITKAATDAGIIICAAAGNGNQNLDDSFYDAYMNRGDNGSIIVGAGTIKGRNKASFSTYGSRVDVQGWGDWCVTTTGYTSLYNGGPHAKYTKDFSGTSSATPIVSSAVVAIQSYAKNELGKTLTPREMRALLKKTGTPQGSGGHIGPLPNVGAAIEELGGSVEDTYLLTVNGGTGSGKYGEGSSVDISAEEQSDAGVFKKWSGDTKYLDDSTKSSTSVTMPAKDITLTALYEIDTLNSENLISYAGWEAVQDSLGSKAEVHLDSLDDSLRFVEITLSKVTQPNDSTYPYANVAAYFQNPFSNVEKFEITYVASKPIKMMLPMVDKTDLDGSAHFVTLPQVAGTTTLQFVPDDFEQPSWQKSKTGLDLDLVSAVAFELEPKDSLADSGSITINSYKMVEYIPTSIISKLDQLQSLGLSTLPNREFMLEVPHAGEYVVTLFSLSGRSLYSSQMQCKKGANRINGTNWQLGSSILLMKIEGKNYDLTKRVRLQ